MRAMLCGCGQRLEAPDNNGLVRETVEHYRWVHGMAVVDGEDIRRIVEVGAYDSWASAAAYTKHENENPLRRSNTLTQAHDEGYGGDAVRSTGSDTR